MRCNTQQSQGQVNCHGSHHDFLNSCGCTDGGFLSKKKQIEVLSRRKEELQERVSDIDEYIAELNKEK